MNGFGHVAMELAHGEEPITLRMERGAVSLSIEHLCRQVLAGLLFRTSPAVCSLAQQKLPALRNLAPTHRHTSNTACLSSPLRTVYHFLN